MERKMAILIFMLCLLSGVSVALLTLYDMCKAVNKNMVIKDIRLLE